MSSLFQNAYYVGNSISGIFYGMELLLYGLTMHTLLKNKRRLAQSDKFFIFLSTAMLFLITIFFSTEVVFGEEMWIVNADYPGGSAAYLEEYASVWYQTMGTASSVILNLLVDALMIFRCYVLYNDYRIVIFPGIIYLTSAVFGIILLCVSGAPNGNFFVGFSEKAGICYYSTTIGLNVITTCLICARILFFSRRMGMELDRSASRPYTNAAALVIESALPYSLFGIAFLVSYGIDNDIQILFGTLYSMFTCISPQLLILRVVAGRAWTKRQTEGSIASSTMFGHGSGPLSRYAGANISDGTAISLQLQTITKSDVASQIDKA